MARTLTCIECDQPWGACDHTANLDSCPQAMHESVWQACFSD